MSAAVRLRLSHALTGATLEPAGMPPSSILFVRRLDDPLPGRLTLRPSGPRSSSAWSRAARSALETHWRHAALPARDAVPANAASVAFADPSEMLACAALAVASGEGGTWWWRALLRGRVLDAAALAELWREQATAVPAACALLVRAKQGSRALAVFTPRQTIGILVRVAYVHGIDVSEVASEPEVLQGTNANRSAPWAPWVPETIPLDLSHAHRTLIGIALALHRAPAAASAALDARLVEWWRGSTRTAREADQVPDTMPVAHFAEIATRPVVIDNRSPAAAESAALPQSDAAIGDTRRDATLEAHDLSLGAAAGHPGEIRSALAGAMFLVHVVRELGLAFLPTAEQPWGAWGWTELLARALLGRSFASHASDALWSVLAELDGRRPGSLLGPALPEARARSASKRQRLGAAAPIVPPGGHHCARLAVARARRRLTGALGLAANVSGDVISRILLKRDATIIPAGAHVDVMFALRDARTDVRLAGLDADPGWQPAFGRVIRFHYVDATDS